MSNAPRTTKEQMIQFREALARAGIRLTHQRLVIFQTIVKANDHPTAEMLYRRVKRKIPSISIDTVYRTLRTLSELGLIGVMGSSGDSVRFDPNLVKHHHFVCVKCGMVRDFENDEYNMLDVQKDVDAIGDVLETHLEVRGICNSCKNHT